MTQYQNDNPDRKTTSKSPVRGASTDRTLENLREQLKQQAANISALEREVKKIKNDLRTAIAAFNTKHNG